MLGLDGGKSVGNALGDTAGEYGRDSCLFSTGCCDTSVSCNGEGEWAGEEPLGLEGGPDCDSGRDKELRCLTAVAGVRSDFPLLDAPPSRGGVCGIELLAGIAVPVRASSDEGARACLWAWKGFLKTVFSFLGADVGFAVGDGPA